MEHAGRRMEGILCLPLAKALDSLNLEFLSWDLNPVPGDWRTAFQEQGPGEQLRFSGAAYILTFLSLGLEPSL